MHIDDTRGLELHNKEEAQGWDEEHGSKLWKESHLGTSFSSACKLSGSLSVIVENLKPKMANL